MLSRSQARRLHLAAQGLLTAPARAATRAGLRACITRMRLLQIDTIHVVARSPYMVLFARLGAYPAHWLDEALASGHIFETWAHEACFAPMAELPRHRSYNRALRQHWGIARGRQSEREQRARLDALLGRIRESGPVRSSDFARSDGARGAGWWGWKDEKRWLEALFANGELMVARRENFQRIYDLSERVAPIPHAMPLPEPGAVHSSFIEQSIAALGISPARWVHDYFRIKPRLRDHDLDALVAQGRLQQVQVEGWAQPGYVHRDLWPWLRKAAADALDATHTTLLSPFDPLVWDRERALGMFDFDYRIECYTPAHKRIHGYYVLPILRRGELVGRVDAKAHRGQGVFEIKSLQLQRGVAPDAALMGDLATALAQCAAWHGTPAVKLGASVPRGLARALRACLKHSSKPAP